MKQTDKAEKMAKMANTGMECLMGCLILHGYESLDHVEKATVLKVIGQELEKTAWRIIKTKKEGNDMCVEKSNVPEFEWVCPNCGGKEYDADSLCLECGCRMISREVTENG